MKLILLNLHYAKSVRIQSFSGPHFPHLQSKSLYSVRMWKKCGPKILNTNSFYVAPFYAYWWKMVVWAELLTRRIWISTFFFVKIDDIANVCNNEDTTSLNTTTSSIPAFFTKLCEFFPKSYCGNFNNLLIRDFY